LNEMWIERPVNAPRIVCVGLDEEMVVCETRRSEGRLEALEAICENNDLE
jgi:hypothetical protein